MNERTPDPGGRPQEISGISTHLSILAEPEHLLCCYGKAIRGYLEALLGPEGADEVARDFTVKILRGDFARWAPGQGRFRDYLKTAVWNAACDWHRRAQRSRRREVSLEELPDLAAGPDARPDLWLGLYRSAVFGAALQALARYQQSHPGNVFYTLVRLLEDESIADGSPTPDYASLAARLTEVTGRRIPYTEDNARQQTSRARRKLAEFLLEEVRRTLETPTPEQLEAEVRLLGLTTYLANLLSATNP
jgi:hypothetical protein